MATKEQLLERSRKLRKYSSDAELHLWYYLRNRQFSRFKFRRQKPIGNYIVDFICLWKKLIIELDGGQHATTIKYDKKRTQFLESKGFKVIRFWNIEVLSETQTVLDVIWNELNSR